MNQWLMSLSSGVIGSLLTLLITIIWTNYKDNKRIIEENNKRQIFIFETLLSNRFMFKTEEIKKAFNLIDIVFYDNKEILNAYNEFIKVFPNGVVLGTPENYEKYIDLLEIMAKELNYGRIDRNTIKRYYK